MIIPALVCNLIICFLIPLIIWVVVVFKNKAERKGEIILFVLGALFYTGIQFGIKQQGLTFLFKHTKLLDFMSNHYIPYIFLVALAGAILAVIPEWITIRFVYRRKVTFKQAISFGLGYTIAETGFITCYPDIEAIVMYIKDRTNEITVSLKSIVLSGFERVLMTIVGTGLIVILVYFVEQRMDIRGIILKVFCHMLVLFLPGFFIAFSTKEYLEVFDSSVTLVMVYVVLAAAAICSYAVMDSLKWRMYEK